MFMKEKTKVIGFECLYLFFVIAASVACDAFQFVGKKLVSDYSDFLFAGSEYKYNPLAYIFGAVLFITCLYALYYWVLKKRIDSLNEYRPGFVIVYVLIALALSFLMFGIHVVELVLLLEINNNILPEFCQFLTTFGWPVATFFFTLGALLKPLVDKKLGKETVEEPELKPVILFKKKERKKSSTTGNRSNRKKYKKKKKG